MRKYALIALAGVVIGALTMPAERYIGDPVALRIIANHFLSTGEISLPEDTAHAFAPGALAFAENARNHRFYLKWPIGNLLLAMPPVLVARALYGDRADWRTEPARTVFILNLYQLLWQACLLALLYSVASLFTLRSWLAALFAFAACYSSLYWNYMRAQSNEIFHLLFFLAAFRELVLFRRAELASASAGVGGAYEQNKRLARGLAWLLAMVFLRPAYWLCIAGLTAFLARDVARGARALAWVIVATTAVAAVYLLHNRILFGSFLSLGYPRDEFVQQTSLRYLSLSLPDYIIGRHFSVFLHFPLLLFALAGYSAFRRRYGREWSVCLWLSVPYILFLSLNWYWRGEWCYGPRLIQCFLAVLALPALAWGDRLLDTWNTREARALAAFACLTLLGFAWMQTYIVRLNFFAYYDTEHLYARLDPRQTEDSPEVRRFLDQPWPLVYRDLARFREGAPLPFRAELEKKLPMGMLDAIDLRERQWLKTNLWWWRDRTRDLN